MSLANWLSGGILDFLGKILDKAIPDPEQKAKAQATLMQAAVDGEIKMLQTEMSVMLAEAQSTDPWTSRARPTFLYVIYLMILMAFPMGVLYLFSPESANKVTMGVNDWLGAIPEAMWWLFGAGYLGYNAARSYDKSTTNGKSGADIMASIARKPK